MEACINSQSVLKTQVPGWWLVFWRPWPKQVGGGFYFAKPRWLGGGLASQNMSSKTKQEKTKIEFKKQRKHNDWKTMRRPRGFYPILDTHSFRQSRRLFGPNQEGSRRREHSIMDSVVGPLLRSQLRVDFILHHGVIINHNLCADICHHGTPGVRPDSHRNTSYLLIKMPKRLWSVFALLIAKHQAKLQVEASTVFKHLDEDNKPTHNVFQMPLCCHQMWTDIFRYQEVDNPCACAPHS